MEYDQNEIEKVLFNLLSNAFKFTPSEGCVSLICKSLSIEQCIEIDSLPEELKDKLPGKKYLYIEVKDNGKGFPAEDSERIFQPFYQAGEDIHQEISGTGIGLSLTRSIILRHEGYIWATTFKDQGSRLIILLPDLVSQPVTSQPEEEVADRGKKVSVLLEKVETKDFKSILVVDDNKDILDYLEKLFLGEYLVSKAANGKEALQKIEKNMPDLIISDIRMPEMNGLELCRHIKENSRLQHIPVILLTSRFMQNNIQEGLAAEADDYIIKPFDVSVLKARVQNILSLRDKMKTVYGEDLSFKNLGINHPHDEEEFLSRYIEIVRDHLSDPDLDISVIYSGLNMSRPTFYRKVKILTGLSPTEVITHIRLETATRLLKETNMTISEIALAVGFNSRSYFAKAFKNTYNMSPSDYQKTK